MEEVLAGVLSAYPAGVAITVGTYILLLLPLRIAGTIIIQYGISSEDTSS